MEERENTIPNTQEENNLRNQEISKEDMDILDSQPFIGGYGFDSETITIFN